MKDGGGHENACPFFKKEMPKNEEEMQAAGTDSRSGGIIKIHKKYWKCMRYSVIMSLSCIA